MKDVQDWIAVKKLYSRGAKIKQIARQLKMSKNTVKRLLKQKEEPKYTREVYKTVIDEYIEQIKVWYLEPEYDFIGTRIFNELKEIGYTGSIGPIYRFLRTLKEDKAKVPNKATVRIETPFGDQAQFDWSPYKVVIGSEIKEVYCFTMILSASRLKAVVFSLTVDADAIYEAIQELFDDLGGITRELVIDNPKALVIENQAGCEPKYNLDALRLATHLGTELNACNPYRARTKGKIEKPYQYIEEQFIKGNTYDSMTELNVAAKEFFKEWNKKVHGTTKRIPVEVHRMEEIKYLQPLPHKRFIKSPLLQRKVSLDSLISVNGKKYSVPVEYVDKNVKYRIVYGYKLEIYSMEMEFITPHEINSKDDSISRLDEHYAPIAATVPKSIPEIKRQFQSTFKSGSLYLERASKVLQQPSYHARQILKLKELYTDESLDIILDYCINNGLYSIDEFKGVLRDKYIDIIVNGNIKKDGDTILPSDLEDSLVRDISYYEGGGQF